jgi:predicted esterase
MARFPGLLLVVATLLMPFAQPQSATDFGKFFAADSPGAAAQAAKEIEKSGVAFDDAWRQLKAGRKYTMQQPGVVMLKNRTDDGVDHSYAVNIPPSYDPARRYQVRFQLHGGVGARPDNSPRGTGEIGALAGAEQIYVLPYAGGDTPWWTDDQILNLNTIVDTLKRTYNVDENRVVVSGVSDGATGSYYIAMRDTTPFASFLPLNGFIMVLTSDEIDDGFMFPNNLRNKPLFVVNGGRDRLYPTHNVEPFTKHLIRSGVEIDYHPQPEGEHNTKWWPEVKDSFEKFVADHPRNPHPDKLTWEAGDKIHNRAHWLVIDEFGAAAGEAKALPDANLHLTGAVVAGRSDSSLFPRFKSAGRVDLVRTGNTVEASTNGVTAFTLLLSPDVFDFDQPIKVVANGTQVFNARVERSLKTLLKWAAEDNDRTMLYAAEIQIKLAH